MANEYISQLLTSHGIFSENPRKRASFTTRLQ